MSIGFITGTRGGSGSSGGGPAGMPVFTYTGTYTLIDDNDGNWRIKFLSSGTLRFTNLGTGNGYIDIFCVGGGGSGGSNSNDSYAGSGGGGYTNLGVGVISKNIDYDVQVGGSETRSYFSDMLSAEPGQNGTSGTVGGGGSGGGAPFQKGGSDGSDGPNYPNSWIGGKGMGTYAETGIYYVREFREASGQLYSGGGGGGGNVNSPGKPGGAGGGGYGGTGAATHGISGSPNTGGGGGGKYAHVSGAGASGGSGIVIIRNHRGVS